MTGVIETLKRGKTLFETRVEKSASRDWKNTEPQFFQTVTALNLILFTSSIFRKVDVITYRKTLV